MKHRVVMVVVLLAVAICACAYAAPADDYNKAMELMCQKRYKEAAAAFEKVSGYEEATKYAIYCKACNAGESGDYDTAVRNLEYLGDFADSQLMITYYTALKYERRKSYDQAQAELEPISLFRDGAERIASYPDKMIEDRYNEAEMLYRWGMLEKAASIYEELGEYKDSRKKLETIIETLNEQSYQEAVSARDAGNLIEAYDKWTELGDYKDSAECAKAIREPAIYAKGLLAADQGRFSEACAHFSNLGDYKDSERKAYLFNIANFANKICPLGEHGFGFRYNGLWGIGNWETNLVSEACWDSVGKAQNNALMIVGENGLYGCIDENGHTVIEPHYVEFGDYNVYGLAKVKTNSGYGAVNSKGNEIVACQYDSLGVFGENALAKVEMDHTYGYVNTKGETIVPCIYSDISTFRTDYAVARDKGGKWTLVSAEGRDLFTEHWDEIADAADGSPVAVRKGNLWGFADHTGEILTIPAYEQVSSFSEGICAVKRGDYWGYVNAEGQEVVLPTYEAAEDFAQGKAGVYATDSGWNILKTDGKRIYFVNDSYNEGMRLLAAGDYDSATKVFQKANDAHMEKEVCYWHADSLLKEGKPAEAGALFASLGDYGDASSRVPEAYYAEAEQLYASEDHDRAAEAYVKAGAYADAAVRAQKIRYDQGEQYLATGDTEDAIAAFELAGNYSDARERIQKIWYTRGEEYLASGRTADAVDALKKAGALDYAENIRDYEKAEKCQAEGKYAAAYDLWSGMLNYKDSKDRVAAIRNQACYEKGLLAARNGYYKNAYQWFDSIKGYEDSERKAYIFSVSDFAEDMKQLGGSLFGYRFKGVWGIGNWDKNVIVASRWDAVDNVQTNGLLKVQSGKKYGCIDSAGKVIVKAQYSEMESFGAYKLAKVKTSTGYGYINERGEEIIPCKYMALGSFDSQGYAKARLKEGYGYVTATGKEAVRCQYTELDAFGINGLARAGKGKQKIGYVNRQGREVIPCEYAEVSGFNNGLCTVAKQVQNDIRFGIMDEKGKTFIAPEWYTLGDSTDNGGTKNAVIGVPVFRRNVMEAQDLQRKWTLLSNEGTELCEERWDEFTHFDDKNMMAVRRGKAWGFIDNCGKVIAEPIYEEVAGYHENICAVRINGKWGYMDRSGQEVIIPVYAKADNFEDGRASVYSEDSGWHIIAKDGVRIYFIDENYSAGMEYMSAGEYEKAIEVFASAGDVQMEKTARYHQAERLFSQKDYSGARIQFVELGDYADASVKVLQCHYEEAEALLAEKKYDEAAGAFEKAGEYLDAKGRAEKSWYDRGLELQKTNEYDLAKESFVKAEGYLDADQQIKECNYQKAKDLFEKGEKEEALSIFLKISDYKDVTDIVLNDEDLLNRVYTSIQGVYYRTPEEIEEKRKPFKTVGNTVYFGHYEQDDNLKNGQERIEWQVLKVAENKSLLLSKFVIDAKPYNAGHKITTWETSTLRGWLNKDFLNQTFSESEQKSIMSTSVDNGKTQVNNKWSTVGGNNTTDKLFLLSYADAFQYFKRDADRKAKATAYAIREGAFAGSGGSAAWWLRSPGTSTYKAAYITRGGYSSNDYAENKTYGIRPVLWINLESDLFINKEKSEVTEKETQIPKKIMDAIPKAYFRIAKEKLEAGDIEGAVEALSRAGDNPEAKELLQKTLYEKGKSLFNEKDFEGAIQVFEQIAGYSDADKQVLQINYEWGETLLGNGEFDKAEEAFTRAEGYKGAADAVKETKYQKAAQLVEKGDFKGAYAVYKEIRDYRDVAGILKNNESFKTAYLEDFKTVGSIVTFGHYEQDNVSENGAEDIEWIVLARDGKHILLLSRYGLDANPYNAKKTNTTWEKSSIRKWLNADFTNAAFTKEEQKALLTTRVDNSTTQGNKGWKTKGGNNTKDQVFLLSYKEAGKYLVKSADRVCKPTLYAEKQGVSKGSTGTCSWWLRSPGSIQSNAAYVNTGGSFISLNVSVSDFAVRPALWIDLDSDIF